ncbi:GAP family protein [Paenibacillus yanchengensis]|uniref:GAP family protein n=1 Tax=Paenibacillus yanchengensis TaxID=2035833 RepID=A0ABW4YFZ9_9BACL
MDLQLVISVAGLALLDTLSPATIGVTIYLLLTEKKQLLSRLSIYLITVALLYFLTGIALMLGMDMLFTAAATILQNRIISWSTFIIGMILFIMSFYYPEKKQKQLPQPKSKQKIAMVALGVTTYAIEVGTAVPYFAAIGLLSTSELAAFQWLPMLAGYNLIMVLPPLILFILHLLLGRTMQRSLEKLQMTLAKHTGSAVSWILCIVGLVLIFNSLDYL